MRVLFLLCFVFNICHGQGNDGTLLIVVTRDAKVFVDGEDKGEIKANKPLTITLRAGEHFIQAEGVNLLWEASEIVQIEQGKQKVLKLELKESTKDNTPHKSEGIQNVAELNFSIPGSMVVALWMTDNPGKEYPRYPNYYYAFEEGDEIVIDCSMTNAKGTNLLVVSTYPDKAVKYSNRVFTELKDLRIKVEQRGIFRFSLATNHVLDRNAKLVIRRLPRNPEKLFNTTVAWQKKYIVVNIQTPQEYWVNSGSNADFKGGKSRIVVPVLLPENTVEWYYTFTASRSKEQIQQTKSSLKLFSQLTRLVGGASGGALNIGLNQLTQAPGSDYCDIYLMDKNNSQYFEAKTAYRYYTEGTRENIKSGIIQVKGINSGYYYIGIKNPDYSYGVAVALEIAAVVVEEGWEMVEK